jgi:murein DD-endopeptidase MepM/ murein hydrolase activator NlpD
MLSTEMGHHSCCSFTRLTFLRLMGAAGLMPRALSSPAAAFAQADAPRFSYPVGLADRTLADGLVIRHGYATENTWYNPGWWHTGEDWYLDEGESAGVPVHAVAAGEVLFAGSEYPGLVVIVQHEDDLYSMYGHLDYELAIETGQTVERGDLLGTILARSDGRAPSHLHFELRTFYTTTEVNGDAPRYEVGCGFDCPPGPGYWPMDAPEHPVAMGWRNPAHVINRRMWADGVPEGMEAVVAETAPLSVNLWTSPADADDAEAVGELALTPGDRYPLLAIEAGDEDSTGSSAEAYRLWYQIAVDDDEVWVQAAVPSTMETGSDGRASSVQFNFLPAAVPN